MNKIFLGVIFILVIAGGTYFILRKPSVPVKEPTVQDSHFDLIRVESLTARDLVASPLTVTGRARGNWYFEASFPVKLLDADGNVLVEHYAQAQGDPVTGEVNWMTTDFVSFSATLTFTMPATETGTLILQKDNPSGEPQFDDSLSIPVRFRNGDI